MTTAGTNGACRASWSPGAIRLHDPHLFSAPGATACRDFLRRAFQVDLVRAIEIAPGAGAATLRYAPADSEPETILDRLEAALRSSSDDAEPRLGPIPSTPGSRTPFTVRRYGELLSTWDAVHQIPGRVRFRQGALAIDRTLADRVARELPSIHGVRSSRVRPLTASLVVEYDPAILDVRRLVQLLDGLLRGPASSLAYEGDPAPVRFGLANTALALAALGEFVVPALLPASAVLLVGSNVKTLRTAWQDARQRQAGLPALYSTILAGTLASGQFVAATLMGWMFHFWRHQHRERLLATRNKLLPGIAQHARFARLCRDDSCLEVPLEGLQPGDRIEVEPGDLVVADGRVVDGWALVDERLVRGLEGLTPKRPGDRAFAGSCLVRGALRFEVERVGRATRAAAVARALFEASSPATNQSHGEALARRAVVPTLATAGFGLLVGDLSTATAVLRPDYATGPGLGLSQTRLEAIGRCARDGILVRDPSIFARLADVQMVLLDDDLSLFRPAFRVASVQAPGGERTGLVLRLAATAFRDIADDRTPALISACQERGLALLDLDRLPRGPSLSFEHEGWRIAFEEAWSPNGLAALVVLADGEELGRIEFVPGPRPAAASALADWRRDDPLPMGLLSGRTQPAAQAQAAALGVEQYLGGLSSDAKAAVVAWYRDRGVRVAFVGDCRRESKAARAAHLAISLADGAELDADPAPILLLRRDLSRLAALRILAREHLARVRTIHGSAVIPNLACVAGAFLFGFTSMSSVIVTNLGTLGIYSGLTHRGGIATRSRRAR
jgi:cation transport ATPase